MDVIGRMNWFEPTRWMVTRVGLDIDLFGALVADNNSPKSSKQLAQKTGCDPVLISRFLKHLNAAGFVKETGPNEYIGNDITAALATRIPSGTTKNCYDCMNLVHGRLPEFFRKTNYKSPTNHDASPFKYGFNTDLTYWEWISLPENEQSLEDFKAHMESKTLGKKWFQSADMNVEELLGKPSDPSATLMIDIGGSFGHDIIDFHKAFPDLPGKLVLQELPATIKNLPSDFPKDIEAQAYDFFTPQPIKHAKAYFLHMILHDWPDDKVRQILGSLTPAMKKGHSKILLNEIVIPDQGADWFATSVDMIMLACHAAKERTESDWRAVLKDAGLQITKIWDCEGNVEKIIEVELA
ncbi:S-adenosyl-L-methionine-dependent methyltransferase [Corynespora cassiicola Philippines]|uniref:S-adenosyl-L-methionine-dependent methyltransferase n=1 Tax=Corynespora cassiicola Philippines TaxID=1448308 RepID=A0A2T2PA45_CORCC|nr:S-adenosyl-L-methionine-dependent methyltransferase [Corynespora cassiicola Philippines]